MFCHVRVILYYIVLFYKKSYFIFLIRVRGLVPRTAHLIPGRGGKWDGWRRDVRRRRFRRRCRRFRSPGWVAAWGRATHYLLTNN